MTPERHLSISNIAWNPDEDAAVADLLVGHGFRGVEIAPTTRWPSPLDAPRSAVADYRDWWRERGIEIVAMQSLLFGREDLALLGSNQQRRALVDYLTGIAELAATLGARALVFGSPKNRRRGAMSVADATALATDTFREIGARIEEHGVVLCIEPNPPAYGCDFVTTMREAVALASAVDSPAIGVQGDLGAITINGESTDEWRAAGALLAHVHASEPHLVEPGTGGADHTSAASTLELLDYGHWVSIEMKKQDGARLDAVARAVSLVAGTYGRIN